jgi:hypothetical protein
MDLLPRRLQLSEKFTEEDLKSPNVTIREVNSEVQPRLRSADSNISRHQQLNFMIISAFLGVLIAVGHHAFYLKLDRTFTGSEARQQLAHTFGNILAISVATCFAFASRAAYKQYFWTVCIFSIFLFSARARPWRNKLRSEPHTDLDILQVVRRNSFTITALDRLYSLTSDLLGFFNAEIWKEATLAVFLALTCW